MYAYMTTEDVTNPDSSDKDKKEPSTLPAETSENDTAKPTNEKKVVVVTPLSKTEYKTISISVLLIRRGKGGRTAINFC